MGDNDGNASGFENQLILDMEVAVLRLGKDQAVEIARRVIDVIERHGVSIEDGAAALRAVPPYRPSAKVFYPAFR